jgi:hypothetical protein
MHALEGAVTEEMLTEICERLFRQVEAFAGGGDADQRAAAAAMTSLGWLVAHCSWSTSCGESIITQTFSLAVHTLTTLAPAVEPLLMQIVSLLPSDSLLSLRQTPHVDAAVAALAQADPESGACMAYSAVSVLVRIGEAAPAAEAEALSPLLLALIKVTQGHSKGMQAGYGVLVAAVALLPCTVASLRAAGLAENAAAILRPELPRRMLTSTSDTCLHRAAAVAQAQLLMQQGSNIDSRSGGLTELLGCPQSSGGAGAGGTKVSTSRYATSEAATVCSVLLGTFPELGSVARACMQGVTHGLLRNLGANGMGVLKEVASELERCGLSRGRLDLLSAWLLARCARVCPNNMLQYFLCGSFRSISAWLVA